MWRGARTGDRQWLTEIGQRKNDSNLDIQFMDWNLSSISPRHSENFKTIQQFCEYQYLLHQEEWSYSNRLKYLLLCGSPVVFAHFREWEEYWYHLLKLKKTALSYTRHSATMIIQFFPESNELEGARSNEGDDEENEADMEEIDEDVDYVEYDEKADDNNDNTAN
ncbi:unnamed protein product [Adineta ricciae]|uniref:Glycosyl transferase CAP10 domain-containing protein n=1 Tax=Adineta ricciae TaxID=249248 RepID=A0A815PK66_ADIRI|nr:unnamed protein product [Adineta ricciae]